jgi:hypothetical protein
MASSNAAVVQPSEARVPGLDPEAPYFSRLSARSALYTEFRLLLEAQGSALSSAEYRKRVIEDKCLARSSASARRKLWEELHSRYRLDAGDPLFMAFWNEWKRSGSETERSLTAYVLLAMNDRLVADLGTDWLFSLLRRAPATIRVDDVRMFLTRSAERHPEVLNWSEQTTRAVVQKYCASIRDFGLASGTINKKTVRPALYGAPVRLLVSALRLVGTPLMNLVQAPAFRLLGIDTSEVIDALGELNRQGALHFRIQGDVVEIELPEAA